MCLCVRVRVCVCVRVRVCVCARVHACVLMRVPVFASVFIYLSHYHPFFLCPLWALLCSFELPLHVKLKFKTIVVLRR